MPAGRRPTCADKRSARAIRLMEPSQSTRALGHRKWRSIHQHPSLGQFDRPRRDGCPSLRVRARPRSSSTSPTPDRASILSPQRESLFRAGGRGGQRAFRALRCWQTPASRSIDRRDLRRDVRLPLGPRNQLCTLVTWRPVRPGVPPQSLIPLRRTHAGPMRPFPARRRSKRCPGRLADNLPSPTTLARWLL